MTAPDFVEEFLGFRGWRVSASGLLMSSAADDGWVPGDNLAVCARGVHEAPTVGCGCGLYAHYELADVPGSVGQNSAILAGAVLGWGRVILHPDGWRAQYGRVIAFFRSGPAASLMHAERMYGVPVFEGPWQLPADVVDKVVPKKDTTAVATRGFGGATVTLGP